ncbi:MAG: protein phosphatase 2C domain-containing protein [Ktedonobacteraceae bacterium]
MSTQSILSRLHKNTIYGMVSLLGGLLISLQLVLPATTFAASPRATSSGYTFGNSQSLDLASVAVVRLVVTKFSHAPNPKLTPCSTGLGVIVSSSGQQQRSYLNYVLTDTSFLTTKPCLTNAGTTIAIYKNDAYTNNDTQALPLAAINCVSDLTSCTANSSPSSSGTSSKTKCQDNACTTGVIALPFLTPNPQPYLGMETTLLSTSATFAIQLDSAPNVTSTPLTDFLHHLLPVKTVQQTNGNATTPTATTAVTPSATQASLPSVPSTSSSLEVGTPVVDNNGLLAGININTGTNIIETPVSALTTLIPPSANNALQTAWEADIADFYTQKYPQVINQDFQSINSLNPDFLAVAGLKSVATIKQQQATDKTKSQSVSAQSSVWYEKPFLLLAILGLIVVVLLLLLINFVAGRRRRELARFKKEQEGAEQRAEVEAQRIRKEEEVRYAEQAQGQHVPSPFATPAASAPVQGMLAGSQTGPVDLHCPNCGYPYIKGESFCSNCRAVLAPSESGYHVRMIQPPPQPQAPAPPLPNIQPQSPVLMPSSSISEMPTLEMSPSQRSLAEETTAPGPGRMPYFNGHNVSIAVGSGSDPGIKRKQKPNEDSLLAVMGERTHNSLPQQFGLFVVADGMGGHANGQDASRLAIQTMVDRILPRLSSSEDLDDQALAQMLVNGVQQANMAVYERNLEHHADMGTTMTSAIVVGGMAYVANVGDSRTYMYREPEGLHKITHDHSVVASLVEAGIIRNEDIYTHPKRNQIYRSLGEKPDLEVDSFVEPLQPGDKLLLCSDGLWEMVHDRDAQRDKDIQRILSIANADPKQTVNALINAANEGGGEDNISAIVVSVSEATAHTGMTGIHLLDKPETVQMPQM